jgi:hypothetical protein
LRLAALGCRADHRDRSLKRLRFFLATCFSTLNRHSWLRRPCEASHDRDRRSSARTIYRRDHSGRDRSAARYFERHGDRGAWCRLR